MRHAPCGYCPPVPAAAACLPFARGGGIWEHCEQMPERSTSGHRLPTDRSTSAEDLIPIFPRCHASLLFEQPGKITDGHIAAPGADVAQPHLRVTQQPLGLIDPLRGERLVDRPACDLFEQRAEIGRREMHTLRERGHGERLGILPREDRLHPPDDRAGAGLPVLLQKSRRFQQDLPQKILLLRQRWAAEPVLDQLPLIKIPAAAGACRWPPQRGPSPPRPAPERQSRGRPARCRTPAPPASAPETAAERA